jgi:hypothetical protein
MPPLLAVACRHPVRIVYLLGRSSSGGRGRLVVDLPESLQQFDVAHYLDSMRRTLL